MGLTMTIDCRKYIHITHIIHDHQPDMHSRGKSLKSNFYMCHYFSSKNYFAFVINECQTECIKVILFVQK